MYRYNREKIDGSQEKESCADLVRQVLEFQKKNSFDSSYLEEFQYLCRKVYDYLKTEEVYERIHNVKVWENITKGRESGNEKLVDGIIMPGGGLSCVAGYGPLKSLLEHHQLSGIDHIIASSGSSWVAANCVGALQGNEMEEKLKYIRRGISVFTRDLRGNNFVPKDLEALRRMLMGRPMADLSMIEDITSGRVPGQDYTKFGKDKSMTKSLNVDFVRSVENPVQLHIPVTDSKTGESTCFETHKILNDDYFFKVMRASSSMPVVFGNGENISGTDYQDGDLSMDYVSKAEKLGINSMLVLLSKPMDRELYLSNLRFVTKDVKCRLRRAQQLVSTYYIYNLLKFSEYAKANSVYVIDPNKEFHIEAGISEDRSSKMHALYMHMYKKTERLLEKNNQ